MKKMLLVGTLLAITFGANAGDGASQEFKDASQAMIIVHGFSCKKVDSVIQTEAGEWRVWCNGMYYQYKIVDNGGNYTVTSEN
ncbi:Uncharacterised protein [Yersinia frederiksenii]|uniref:Lipoprotein n=2 Tax=Yersinia frederiksenii TaxID=29484 RepID=A0A380PQJ8_YERFR|nr:hypothetical protein [Yersinia frederiksenii]ATM95783.1 hypothetical protein CRN75_10690 [Yersinia frederiksenii]KGA44535.1 hypothetical protein DJ58_3155 [Yersinia frederiksenii ATCC 33641]MDN0117714.1 hypothetical protein [Yersinia frederiksenii]SUP75569.1 Uncharacterised protein [Yersinia frederiksenii]